MALPLDPEFKLSDDDWAIIAADAGPFDHLAFGENEARTCLEGRLTAWLERKGMAPEIEALMKTFRAAEELIEGLAATGTSRRQIAVVEAIADEAASFHKALPELKAEAMMKVGRADKPEATGLLQAIGSWWVDDLGRKIAFSNTTVTDERRRETSKSTGSLIRVIETASRAVGLPLLNQKAASVRRVMPTLEPRHRGPDGIADDVLEQLVAGLPGPPKDNQGF